MMRNERNPNSCPWRIERILFGSAFQVCLLEPNGAKNQETEADSPSSFTAMHLPFLHGGLIILFLLALLRFSSAR